MQAETLTKALCSVPCSRRCILLYPVPPLDCCCSAWLRSQCSPMLKDINHCIGRSLNKALLAMSTTAGIPSSALSCRQSWVLHLLTFAFSAPKSLSPTASTVPNSFKPLIRMGLTVTPTSAPFPTNRTSAPAPLLSHGHPQITANSHVGKRFSMLHR